MPEGNAAEPAGVPASSLRKWEVEGFRVKWIAGKGIGQSHGVATEEEAEALLHTLKAVLPDAIGWKIIAIRFRMIT